MMALNLNLLHEEFTQERQRKRDPLKLGIKGLIGIGVDLLPLLRMERLPDNRDPE